MRFLLALALVAAFAPSAQAETYPVLETYTQIAQRLVQQTEAAQTEADVQAIDAGTRELIQYGIETMNLYVTKNPVCKEQFDAFFAAYPTMETLPLKEADQLYHSGKGLPAAPKHCYLGRSQVIHPVLNLIRMKSAWSEDLRRDLLADFDEVIEHVERVQKNLDNPPN
jgi:hypothetical protein